MHIILYKKKYIIKIYKNMYDIIYIYRKIIYNIYIFIYKAYN